MRRSTTIGMLGALLAALTACTPADEPVGFTTDSFGRIGPDQVLVAAGRDKSEVVPRTAFERAARDSCE